MVGGDEGNMRGTRKKSTLKPVGHPVSALAPCPTHQAVYLVVGHPQLLQRARHRLQVLQLLEAVAPQRQRLERLQPRQVADLVQAVGGQRQMAAALEGRQAGVHLLDGRAQAAELHALQLVQGRAAARPRRPLGQRVLAGRGLGRHLARFGAGR